MHDYAQDLYCIKKDNNISKIDIIAVYKKLQKKEQLKIFSFTFTNFITFTLTTF